MTAISGSLPAQRVKTKDDYASYATQANATFAFLPGMDFGTTGTNKGEAAVLGYNQSKTGGLDVTV